MIRLLSILILLTSCTASKTIINATGSFDPDGWIAAQKLEQISGKKAVIKETQKLFYELILPAKGSYEFRLTVMDNDSATTSKVIQKIK
ncbi:MAG TPA: hypothetical protein VIM07_15160 [Chitinophagaceae bacterium]